MENLNAEQVKKGLERCANEWHCGLCGFTEKECALIKKSALALINSQEQRIKELTAEYDSMAKSVNEASDLIRKLRADKKELAEENEKIGIENFDLICELSRIKDDTVRKMQRLIEERLDISADGYSTEEVKNDVFDIIDQIAKELSE